MPDETRVASTVEHFRELPPSAAGADQRARMLRMKMDHLRGSAQTALGGIQQLLRQLDSPREMLQILQEEARYGEGGIYVRIREALAELQAIELDDPQELYGRRVDRAIQILEELCPNVP